MGLIVCSDCSNNISSEAPACPYCGKPMAQPVVVPRRAPARSQVSPLRSISLLAVIAVVVYVGVWYSGEEKKIQAEIDSNPKIGDKVSIVGNGTAGFAATDPDILLRLEKIIRQRTIRVLPNSPSVESL